MMQSYKLALIPGDLVQQGHVGKFVCDLSEEAFRRASTASDKLNAYQREIEKLEIAARNVTEAETFLEKLGKPDLIFRTRGELDSILLEVNRTYSNALSAIRMYLDHTESRLIRWYESPQPNNHSRKKRVATSEQLITFKKEAANAYDNCFAYKFSYKLRNYVQHVGLPFTEVIERRTESGQSLIEVNFNLPNLLNAWEDWGNVQPELEKRDSLSAKGHLHIVIRELRSLENKIFESEKAQLRKLGNEIKAVVQPAKGKRGEIALAEVTAIDVTHAKSTFYHLPWKTLQRIGIKL